MSQTKTPKPRKKKMADESLRVVAWRYDRLVEVGLSKSAAIAIATETSVDVHDVRRLVSEGCPPHLVKEIVL